MTRNEFEVWVAAVMELVAEDMNRSELSAAPEQMAQIIANVVEENVGRFVIP